MQNNCYDSVTNFVADKKRQKTPFIQGKKSVIYSEQDND